MTHEATTEPDLELASPGRRLAGWAIEWGFGLVLFLLLLLVAGAVGEGSGDGGTVLVLGMLASAVVYIVWLLVAASRGQTPGKQILGMYVVKKDDRVAGLGYVLLREIVVKTLVAILGAIIFGIGWFIAALWCTWDKDRQCLWDKVIDTRVVHARHGIADALVLDWRDTGDEGSVSRETGEAAENLRTLGELHERGLLTDEEYEERRAREMERL